MKFKGKLYFYFLPLFLILLFWSYHYYRFYEDNIRLMASIVKIPFYKEHYGEVQKQHPYYDVYALAQKYKNTDTNIIYIFEKREDSKLDYSGTYYFNKYFNKGKTPEKYFLSELGIMINYYFYPRLIEPITLLQFNRLSPSSGIIISDYPLHDFPKLYPKVKLNKLSDKAFHKANKRPEEPYYIYEIK